MLDNPDKLVESVGRRIAELRLRSGKTQEQLAEDAGVSVNYWAKVEGGGQNLTLRSLAKLGNALGTRAADLLRPPSSRRRRLGRPKRRNKRASS